MTDIIEGIYCSLLDSDSLFEQVFGVVLLVGTGFIWILAGVVDMVVENIKELRRL